MERERGEREREIKIEREITGREDQSLNLIGTNSYKTKIGHHSQLTNVEHLHKPCRR